MQNIRTCRTCGGPINRGSTAGTGHNGVCLICLVAQSLKGWRPK